MDFDYNELRPCPWCGNTPRIVEYQEGFAITCGSTIEECSMKAESAVEEKLPDAITLWNHRA